MEVQKLFIGEEGSGMRHRIRNSSDSEMEMAEPSPLPMWFRLDRDNISHLEDLIYDKDGNEHDVGKDIQNVKKWIEEALCGSTRKSTGLKCLCSERGSMNLWDYIMKFKLEDGAETKLIVLYLIHEVKMEMVKRMIDYLVEKRKQLELKDWFILVGYFFDRCKKLNVYSSSSLEMEMPENLFKMLLKVEVQHEPLVRYAELFYKAMLWFAIHGRSYSTTYRHRNEETLERFEVDGTRIYNKVHRIKSIEKKFFSQLRRSHPRLYYSIYSETGGGF